MVVVCLPQKRKKRRQRALVALYENRYHWRGVILEALPLIWAAFLIDPGRVSWE
jgi:hypothetical protein